MSISCMVSGVISCCIIDRVWYMSAVLSTRSTVSALGSGRRGMAMIGDVSDAKMGWGVAGVGGSSAGGVEVSV